MQYNAGKSKISHKETLVERFFGMLEENGFGGYQRRRTQAILEEKIQRNKQ
ncbi:hypothetical protein KHA80_21470 [Anaerobacillus sp. HL2]|nr:hypothetical protein KHA80_21470 [Anaerobacillus sp. HL2]